MSKTPFQFNLYRLNIVDEDQAMLGFMGDPIRGDADIKRLLKSSVNPDFDSTTENEKTTLKWSLREFIEFTPEGGADGEVLGLVLARSLMSQAAPTVTDDGIEDTRSEMRPAPAITVHMFFYMQRHIVAVEHHSAIFATDAWRKAVHGIFKSAAKEQETTSTLQLEPIPGQDEILNTFRSFSKLVKLRVKLRMPNPEMTRITERLKDDMEKGGVREYLHQMYSPNGLNKSEDAIPFAAVALAQAGYKDGEVFMEGTKDGKRQKIKTGLKAERTGLDLMREFVKGALANAKTKECNQVLSSVIKRINEVVLPPANGERKIVPQKKPRRKGRGK
jgi:hypothetical protein